MIRFRATRTIASAATAWALGLLLAAPALVQPATAAPGGGDRAAWQPIDSLGATDNVLPLGNVSAASLRASGLSRGTSLYSFLGPPDAADSFAGLTPDGTGGFFGTSDQGGNVECAGSGGIGCGTVFHIAPSASGWVETVIYKFSGSPGDAAYPNDGELYMDGHGNLFGVTVAGGSGPCAPFGLQGCGAIYELAKSSSGFSEKLVYSFQGGADGYYPRYGLTPDASGALYGDTELGGNSGACASSQSSGCGVIYKLTPSGSGYQESVIHRFSGSQDGEYPDGHLATALDGAVYGTTFRGGSGPCATYSHGCGTVFELKPGANGYRNRILYSFQGGSDGALAQGGVVRDARGALYGVTVFGGTGPCFGSGDPPGCGVAFKLAPMGRAFSETIMHTFDGADGARSLGALYLANHGIIYGTAGNGGSGPCTVSAGITGCGVAYELIPTSSGYSEEILHSFGTSKNDGKYPNDPIIDGHGLMYTTTAGGGMLNFGTVARIRS